MCGPTDRTIHPFLLFCTFLLRAVLRRGTVRTMKREFIGLYIDGELKKQIQQIANAEHRSLSAQCVVFLSDAVVRRDDSTHGETAGQQTPKGSKS